MALGLAARSVETASNSAMFLILLPFLDSGFVPTSSMPHQAGLAVAWCAIIAVASFLWAKSRCRRRPVR